MNARPAPSAADLINRRRFLRSGACGIGSLALGNLLADDRGVRAVGPHFPATAKNIIFLMMAGAPSQLDLFEDKPKLSQLDGKTIDPSLIADMRFPAVGRKGVPKLLGSPYRFQRHGQSGAILSELLPNLATVVDDIAFIKSMHTNTTAINHQDGQLFFTTGALREGHPSLGAWVSYGLGNANQDLPGFVVLISNQIPRGGASIYGPGFLPGQHQGVPFRGQGDPVLFLGNPDGVTSDARRRSLDTLNQLNRMQLNLVGDPEISTRIDSFELAYKMQTSVPGLMDIRQEPESVLAMYGAEPGAQSFANNCLLARRLVEQGVRMVQLVDLDWDHHGDRKQRDLLHALPAQCRGADQAVTALLADLKQRGLLEETLVVWGAEFGRTPMREERNDSGFLGRDHHTRAFTIWMAGGGVKPGVTYGATDDIGLTVTENPVHTHDLHATILHLLGIDHKRLTYRHSGRDFRLTDVAGNVVRAVLA
jgi:uncharacterized protein (DUF1501 family)